MNDLEKILHSSIKQLDDKVVAYKNRENNFSRQINATNDVDAVLCWLSEYREQPATYRSYKKEADRLLLWCMYKQQALSNLDRNLFAEYLNFLSDPQPRSLWCTQGKRFARNNAKWRPFAGPLSANAKKTAVAIIDSLLSYLVQANYLVTNPLRLLRSKYKNGVTQEERRLQVWSRILEIDEWQALLITLENLPEKTMPEKNFKERVKFLITILYMLGLRINELATHTWNAFRNINGYWWFLVKGKGSKEGKIPVNSELLTAIIRYRQHCNLLDLPTNGEDLPIIYSERTKRGVTVKSMYLQIKVLGVRAAKIFKDQPDKAGKLCKLSPHWLRHFSATQQDRCGIKFKHIQENHRHSHGSTTQHYIHAIDQDRHIDMQKLSMLIEQ